MAIYSIISALTENSEYGPMMPKFSLVLATVGRTEELAKFLVHLDAQTYREFELIIVDQNPSNVLNDLVRAYSDRFPITYVPSKTGLSRARNVGLQHISGDVVAFPDDDCWYASDTLERVAEVFREHRDYDGISGVPLDDACPGSFSSFPRTSGSVTRKNVWRCASSITIFLRSTVVRRVGLFDEDLGAGSNTARGSAEETDYLIRAIDLRFNIHYCPNLCIFHPYPQARYDGKLCQKGYRYSVGFGYVLRKHKYSIVFVLCCWLRACAAAVSSLLTFNLGKSRYHFAVLKGRVMGWLV